jgi:hypothetical protein
MKTTKDVIGVLCGIAILAFAAFPIGCLPS